MTIDNTDDIDIQVDDYQNNAQIIYTTDKRCLYNISILCILVMSFLITSLAIITLVIYIDTIFLVIVNIAIFVSDNIWVIWLIILSLLFFFIFILCKYTNNCEAYTPV